MTHGRSVIRDSKPKTRQITELFSPVKSLMHVRGYPPDSACAASGVLALFHQHKQNYGSRRLTTALREEGFEIGRCRVRNLMKKLELFVVQKLRYKNTTDSNHDLAICDNLLDRKFSPEVMNQV